MKGASELAQPTSIGEGGVLVAQVHQLAGRHFSRLLQQHGIQDLNPAQGRIIYALWREDGLTQTELATRTRLDKSTLTLMLQRLEAADQVQRRPDAADSRVRRVFLTKRNRKLHGAYMAASQEMLDVFYRGLTVEVIATFEATLRVIIANLEGYPVKDEDA